MNANEQILALDLGGSKMLSALVAVTVDSNGNRKTDLSGIAKRPLSKDSGKEGVWNAILSAVDETFELTKASWNTVSRIGATIPGVADPKRGFWVYAPFSGISDFPIAEELQDKYDRPVFADNDVNACAWGEKVFGVCQSVDNFVWITISNGIGGGLVLDGKVFPGKFSGAAEIGHFNVEENGALCGCGNRGCLEATAAGPAIARSYREIVAEAVSGSGVDASLVADWVNYLGYAYGKTSVDSIRLEEEIKIAKQATAATIAAEARRGNPLAQAVYRKAGKYVGRAASWAANLVNPEKIVIGGGVAGAFDLLYPSLWETFQNCLFKQANQTISIEKTGLGYEAGLLGAAALAFKNPYIDVN